MTNFGQLVYMQKPKQLSKLITNGSNKEKTKRIEQFPKNPGIEYKANTVPKNTGIPGFCKNTVPYRTGMKFLIPLGPAGGMRQMRDNVKGADICLDRIQRQIIFQYYARLA